MEIKHCACGMSHNCSLEQTVIEPGALKKLPQLLKQYHSNSVLMVSDHNTYQACGKEVFTLLSKDFTVCNFIFPTDDILVPDEMSIALLMEQITSQTDIILAVGSGVINDLCKYCSFKKRLSYISVATAPSMDGYASTAAAMIINHAKITYQTHVPKAIVADTNILKEAPLRMIQAGFGDMFGKYSALCDWKISHLITGEAFCETIYSSVQKALQACINLKYQLTQRNEAAISALMEGLIIVGVNMSYMKSSRPASGSEHHLSHFYEVVGLLNHKPYFLHGIDVAYSTVITCSLRHMLIKHGISEPPKDIPVLPEGRAAWERMMHTVYQSAADCIITQQNKLDFYNSDAANRRRHAIWENREALFNILQEMPTGKEAAEVLSAVGYDMNDFYQEYSRETIEQSILYCKDLKDRYTLFWLLHDLGLLQSFTEKYLSCKHVLLFSGNGLEDDQ